MASPQPSDERFSADDRLPPVEPPSAGFIVQLFVIPAIIVVIIVAVWLLFNWLAMMGTDPRAYVEAVKRDNDLRWQAAHNLADALRAPGAEDLKNDPKVARDLSELLDDELDKAGQAQEDHRLRVFLCRALGELNSPEVVPVLVKASKLERTDEELIVRRAAIESLAVWDSKESDSQTSEMIAQALLNASRDDSYMLREVAAFALGVHGGEEALARLKVLVNDAYPNVRYNAALGLARHGATESAPVLAEMLDPDETAGIDVEEIDANRDQKRQLLLTNGLRGVRQLNEVAPEAVSPELRDAVAALANDERMNAAVRIEAENVLAIIRPAQ